MNKKYLILFLCSAIILITISISVVIFSNSNITSVNEKVNQEIKYLDDKLIGMINSLNNVTFSNSVLLQQNTIKAQENSSTEESSNEQDSSQEENSSDSQSAQGSEEQSQSSSETQQSKNSGGADYSKYNVENQNILLQENNKIDWSYLKNTVEILYSSWPTIMIDLHSINVKNENILNFSNILDSLVVNIEREDKRATLNDLAVLYGLIPLYVEQSSNDTDKINVAYTKSCVVNSYVLLEDNNWAGMQEQIAKASDYFSIIMNSTTRERQQSNISKTYIALNEMNNVINLQDKKLFYLKYINLMESAMEI